MTSDVPLLDQAKELIRAERIDEALKVIWGILVNEPENVEALYYSGGCYFKKGDFTNARRHWERLLEIRPDHERARIMLAKIPLQSSPQSETPLQEETDPGENPVQSDSSQNAPGTEDQPPAAPRSRVDTSFSFDLTTLEEESKPKAAETVQPEHKSGNLKYCPGCGKETSFQIIPPPAWLTTVLGQRGHKTWKMKWRCEVCGYIKE